jgi:predicted NBD/HSP70 family sugar kinase
MTNGQPLTILQSIRLAGQLTRRELAGRLGVGVSMISKLTAELVALGLVREIGRAASQNGRPSDLLGLNPAGAYAVGLDAGGNHLRAVLVDLCGSIVGQIELPGLVMSSQAAILDGLYRAADDVLTQAGLSRGDVRGVGISLYGSVDPASGTVYSWTETPGFYKVWKNFAIRDAFLARWRLPHVYVDDVVRTLGVAELLFGDNSHPSEDFIYVLADTGIGVALMINGQPYVGPSQLAGELGHFPLNAERTPCSCGNVGCLETIASVNAVTNRVAQRLVELQVDSVMSESEQRPAGQPPRLDEIIAAARQGDRLAYRVLNEGGDALGRGIAMTLNLFGAARVVVGGALTASEAYLDAMQSAIRLNVLTKVAQNLQIKRTRLDRFAAAHGAAGIVLNALFQAGEDNVLALTQAAVE